MLIAILCLILCNTVLCADEVEAPKIVPIQVRDEELTWLIETMHTQFQVIEKSELDEKDLYKAYLSLIGALFLLVETGKPEMRRKYKNILALLLFNFKSSFSDPYFTLALNLFMQDNLNPRSLIRAAYSAYSIKRSKLAKSLLDKYKQRKNEVRYRESKIEEGIVKKLDRLLPG